jgi:hypothetical protein
VLNYIALEENYICLNTMPRWLRQPNLASPKANSTPGLQSHGINCLERDLA